MIAQCVYFFFQRSKVDKVRALLAGGADPGIQNNDGQLPMELASDQIKTVFNEELLKATAQSKYAPNDILISHRIFSN